MSGALSHGRIETAIIAPVEEVKRFFLRERYY
jgi:hypothetical protein